jgi:hypothetical protein
MPKMESVMSYCQSVCVITLISLVRSSRLQQGEDMIKVIFEVRNVCIILKEYKKSEGNNGIEARKLICLTGRVKTVP